MKQKVAQPRSRQVWLDVVRVLAIFLMVVLHVVLGYLFLWSEQSRLSWLTANAINSFSRVCVPWLLMVSGALLLPQLEKLSWQKFYQKRLLRLLLPWLFWSFVFGLINLWQGNEVSSLKRLIVSTVWTGFWLLPVLAMLYAFAPWWQKLARKVGPILTWLAIFSGVVILVNGIKTPFYLEYFVYFVLGEKIARRPLQKTGLWVGLASWLGGWLAVMILTYQLTVANNAFDYTYYEFHTWPVFLMSIGGFYFFAQTRQFWQNKLTLPVQKIVAQLSFDSFQLYFIHLLFFKFGLNLVIFPVLVFVPLNSSLVFLVSWMGVKLLRATAIRLRYERLLS